MSPARQLRDAGRLLRPAQWPILSAQFLVGALLVSPAALGAGCWLNSASLAVLTAAWAAWVVFLNGGTLAFNSAYDRDTGPVAYLADPPLPPPWLAWGALVWMLAGAALAALVVGGALAGVLGLCVVLSVAYSHPRPRAKRRPPLDLAINMVGYGAGTTAAGILAGRAAYLGREPAACLRTPWQWPPLPAGDALELPALAAAAAGGRLWLVVGFGLLFGSLYPLTQLYQLRQDQERGDRTLAAALGVRGSLALALGLGLLAAAAFAAGLAAHGVGRWGVLAAAALILWLGHLGSWLARADDLDEAAQERGMYRALALWAGVDAALLAAWIL